MTDTVIKLVEKSDQVFTKEFNIEYLGCFADLEAFCLDVIGRENMTISTDLIPYLQWEQVARKISERGYYFEIVELHLRKAGEKEVVVVGSKHTPRG